MKNLKDVLLESNEEKSIENQTINEGAEWLWIMPACMNLCTMMVLWGSLPGPGSGGSSFDNRNL